MKKVFLMLILFLINGLNAHSQVDTLWNKHECIVFLKNGKLMKVESVWSLSRGIMEYKSDGSLHNLPVSRIKSVRCNAVNFKAENDTLIQFIGTRSSPSYGKTVSYQPDTVTVAVADLNPVPVFERDSTINYAALGKSDADEHYEMGGSVLVGVLSAPTFILPPIIAAVEPKPSQKHNPNRLLYENIPEYRNAYQKRAHGKKAAGVIMGMAIGLAILSIAAY